MRRARLKAALEQVAVLEVEATAATHHTLVPLTFVPEAALTRHHVFLIANEMTRRVQQAI